MTTPCDVHKRREIVFHTTPPGQVELAQAFLAELPNLTVRQCAPLTLEIHYCVQEYTLEIIENSLVQIGCHLGTTLLCKVKRALYYYCEDIQRDNMQLPEIHTKDYSLPHVKAWEMRLHGDHDETPEQWRQYK